MTDELDNLDLGKEEKDDFLDDDYNLDSDFGDIDSFGGMDNTTPSEKHSELLKSLTNFQPFLKQAIYGWLGIGWDDKHQNYIKKYKPLMNEDGVMWCISLLQKYARENNIITTIRVDDYNGFMEDVIESIYYNIGCKAEDFGITNNGDIWRISDEMIHSISLVLMGAGDGKYNQLLSTTTQRNESVNVQNQQPIQAQKRKGMMAKMLGKFGM